MKKILIIEDNESARENINDILELEGFETIVAEHGQRGLELARQLNPDLIICDVMMPKLDGYQVLEELEKDEKLAAIPFIFLTAKSTRNDFRQGMNLGSNDYLTKPFLPSELVTAVKAQLRKKQLITQSYSLQINELQQEISKQSQVDHLTKLPNHIALDQLLEQYIAQQRQLSLFLISIDKFDFLSSSFSVQHCDDLIKQIGARIEKTFPYAKSADNVRDIFRVDKSQFVVLTDQIDQPEQPLTRSAQRLNNLLKAPYSLPGKVANLTFSMGIASTADTMSATTPASAEHNLLQTARVALYKAQEGGGNNFCRYQPELSLNVSEKLDLLSALHFAVKNGELQLFYQPQVSLAKNNIVGVEALLRWKSQKLGWISPGKFIPIAEESGLINEIGNWVLYTACQQAKEWEKQFQQAIRISVNLSPIQLAQEDICGIVRMILKKTELTPSLLCLEITETALMQSGKNAIRTLKDLRKMGVQIAIDDFGTGYSSLEYLSTLPCNTIKIDRAFVQNIHERYTNQRIVEAVMNMGHDLQLKIVAEGAETEAELNYLRNQGCDVVQGYVYAKPMPTEVVTKFITAALV